MKQTMSDFLYEPLLSLLTGRYILLLNLGTTPARALGWTNRLSSLWLG